MKLCGNTPVEIQNGNLPLLVNAVLQTMGFDIPGSLRQEQVGTYIQCTMRSETKRQTTENIPLLVIYGIVSYLARNKGWCNINIKLIPVCYSLTTILFDILSHGQTQHVPEGFAF